MFEKRNCAFTLRYYDRHFSTECKQITSTRAAQADTCLHRIEYKLRFDVDRLMLHLLWSKPHSTD